MRASSLCAASLLIAACSPPPRGDIGEVESGLTVCAAGATTKGIDVSHWDGTIDWAKVKSDGVDFAFMKCTEGTDYFDATFNANWSGSAQHGVIPGAYHFFHPATDAVAQADYFVKQAGVPQAGQLPLALDLEVTDNLSGAQVATAALAFLQRVEQKTGITPVVYTSPSFVSALSGTSGFAGYVLWVANWQVTCPSVPSPWSGWLFWQSSDSGTISGISGSVDVNAFNGSLADLQKFVNPMAAPVPDLGGAPSGDLAGPATGADLAGAGDGGGGGAGADLAGAAALGEDAGAATSHVTSSSGCACAIAGHRAEGAEGANRPLVFILLFVLLGAKLVWRASQRGR